MAAAAFSFNEVTKTFGGLCANDRVSFEVATRSIHGVVGENGAGKSTIMKVLYGLYRADGGQVYVDGKPVDFSSPVQAIEHGIGMVHQHFMLVPTLTVWQNIVLGSEPHAWKPNRKQSIATLSALQNEFGFSLDLEARVGTLPVGLQQQVEILKLLYRKADILIFDEPTAVLTPQEVAALITRLKALRDQGKTIVFISHKLREILALTEKVTVLRQGKVVGTYATSELTEPTLAEKMIGRKMAALPPRRAFTQSAPVVTAKGLGLRADKRTLLEDISFVLQPGEVVGVAGIDGNGQQELVEILARAREDYSGQLQWADAPYAKLSAYAHKQDGLAVIPPDRHSEAVVLDFNLAENFVLGHHAEKDFNWHGRLLWKNIFDRTAQAIERFDVRPPNPSARMSGLSGGNQQKLVIARELARPVRLLLAAHPTRGVDIGAIERIHTEILRLRDEGAAVLLFSSELDEILALSDRVLVIYNGRIQDCRRDATNETQLGLLMTGCTV
jgi:ABC-type uncharacterized transport system ATPase subunit